MMNQQEFKAKWNEVKPAIQRAWSRLKEDQLDQAGGDPKAISKLVKDEYGISEDEANRRLEEIFAHQGAKGTLGDQGLNKGMGQALDQAENKPSNTQPGLDDQNKADPSFTQGVGNSGQATGNAGLRSDQTSSTPEQGSQRRQPSEKSA